MMVGKDKIALDVSLGWLLTPLKPAFEREITAQLDKLVGPGLTRERCRQLPRGRRWRQPERSADRETGRVAPPTIASMICVSRSSIVARNSRAPSMPRNAAKPRSRKSCSAAKPASRAGCRIIASAVRTNGFCTKRSSARADVADQLDLPLPQRKVAGAPVRLAVLGHA